MMDKLLPCPFCWGEACENEHKFVGYTSTFGVVCLDCCAETRQFYNTSEDAIAAWNRRAKPENKPLTLEELRGMDGEPVYVVTLDNPLENQPYWAIAGINSNDSRHQNGVALYNRVQGDCGAFDLYGDTWLAYRTKPERSEG